MPVQNPWVRRLLRGLWSLAGLYVALCVVMFVGQEKLLFHPTSIPDDAYDAIAAQSDVEALEIAVDGATLHGFFLRGVGEGPMPTVLYFAGNAQSVWRQVKAKRWVADMGINLAFVSYRGYDRSTGSPSGDAITADGLAVYDAIVDRPEVDGARIVTWGFSLGTGVATHIACNRAVAGVVLMAPYDTLASVAAEQYPFIPVKPLFRHEIDSAACGAKAQARALILHGDQDPVIPQEHGRALADAWGGEVRFVSLEGVGHNDISSHRDLGPETSLFLRSFLR